MCSSFFLFTANIIFFNSKDSRSTTAAAAVAAIQMETLSNIFGLLTSSLYSNMHSFIHVSNISSHKRMTSEDVGTLRDISSHKIMMWVRSDIQVNQGNQLHQVHNVGMPSCILVLFLVGKNSALELNC